MTIQEIKAQLTIAEVLKHYNLKPDKHLRLNCPFHEDKTPLVRVCNADASNAERSRIFLCCAEFIILHER